MSAGIENLTTERLRGEPLGMDHLEDLCSMQRDPRVMATLGGVRDEAETRVQLLGHVAHWERYGFGYWAFRQRDSGRFVGRAGLRRLEVGGRDEVELGYGLAAEHWGRGLASEMARASLDVAFGPVGLGEIVCFTLPSNRASVRVMVKAGFRFERPVTHAGLPHVLFRLRASERSLPGLAGPFLARPSGSLSDAFVEMAREFRAAGDPRYDQALGDLPDYLERVQRDQDLAPDRVPQSSFWLACGDRVLGGLRLRHRLNQRTRLDGGHIGYDLRPSARGQGYGSVILALGLAEARQLGLSSVLLTSDPGNAASCRAIQRNGGEAGARGVSPDTGRTLQQYWIDLTQPPRIRADPRDSVGGMASLPRGSSDSGH